MPARPGRGALVELPGQVKRQWDRPGQLRAELTRPRPRCQGSCQVACLSDETGPWQLALEPGARLQARPTSCQASCHQALKRPLKALPVTFRGPLATPWSCPPGPEGSSRGSHQAPDGAGQALARPGQAPARLPEAARRPRQAAPGGPQAGVSSLTSAFDQARRPRPGRGTRRTAPGRRTRRPSCPARGQDPCPR